MWEHSYILQYGGDRSSYIDNFWNCINWDKVSADFEAHGINGGVAPLF